MRIAWNRSGSGNCKPAMIKRAARLLLQISPEKARKGLDSVRIVSNLMAGRLIFAGNRKETCRETATDFRHGHCVHCRRCTGDLSARTVMHLLVHTTGDARLAVHCEAPSRAAASRVICACSSSSSFKAGVISVGQPIMCNSATSAMARIQPSSSLRHGM